MPTDADWQELQGMIATFWQRVQEKVTAQQSPGRLKQWLGMMRRSYPQAEQLFRAIREARLAPEVSAGARTLRHAAGCRPAAARRQSHA